MIKPKDIIVPEFQKVLAGGYKPTEVTAFIEMLLSYYEELYSAYEKHDRELNSTANELKTVSENYLALLNERQTELTPELAATEIVQNAINEANERSAEIYRENIEKTKRICNEIILRYSTAFDNQKEKFVALYGAYSEFLARVMEACKAQAEAINSNTVRLDIDAVRAIDFKNEFRAAYEKECSAEEQSESAEEQ